MKKTFLVVYERGRKNYGGFAVDVNGCGGLGYTVEGVRADLRAGLELYMETCIELGRPLPEPTSNTVTLPIEGETDTTVTYVVERLTIKMPNAKTSSLKTPNGKITPKNKVKRDLTNQSRRGGL